MAAEIIYKYGTYDFKPGPTIGIKTEAHRTPDGSGFGRTYSIELQGALILTGADELNSGSAALFRKIDNLKNALDKDGKLFVIACNPDPGFSTKNYNLISGYPIIDSFDITDSPNQYTTRANYTVVFSMPTLNSGSGADPYNNYRSPLSWPPYIKNCEETWDIEFADERMPTTFNGEKFGYKLAVNHTVNVEGRLAYSGGLGSSSDGAATKPWQNALSYASGKLAFNPDGPDPAYVRLSGVMGMPGLSSMAATSSGVYNHYRKVNINKTAGSVQIQESFLITPSGSTGNGWLPPNAIETFNINTEQSDGVVKVTVQGEIEGLATVNYFGANGFDILESKYAAASGYFNLAKPKFYSRASGAYAGFAVAEQCYANPLNNIVKSKTIGVNPIEGKINYSYEYDTSPIACITGNCILSQNISIEDSLPTDVFAKQVVLGRALGPILQDIGTVNESTRTVNIELVVLPPSSCDSMTGLYATVPTGQVENFINMVYSDLTGQYGQVFVSNKTQNWNFSVGRYNKVVQFTYVDC